MEERFGVVAEAEHGPDVLPGIAPGVPCGPDLPGIRRNEVRIIRTDLRPRVQELPAIRIRAFYLGVVGFGMNDREMGMGELAEDPEHRESSFTGGGRDPGMGKRVFNGRQEGHIIHILLVLDQMDHPTRALIIPGGDPL